MYDDLLRTARPCARGCGSHPQTTIISEPWRQFTETASPAGRRNAATPSQALPIATTRAIVSYRMCARVRVVGMVLLAVAGCRRGPNLYPDGT